MDCCYLIINPEYLHKQGRTRALRFAPVFDNLGDTLNFLYSETKCEDLKVIAISKEDYLKIKEGKVK